MSEQTTQGYLRRLHTNYDRVEILVKKGERAIIKEIAATAGQNVSEYINQAIKERMERDQRMTAEEQE